MTSIPIWSRHYSDYEVMAEYCHVEADRMNFQNWKWRCEGAKKEIQKDAAV